MSGNYSEGRYLILWILELASALGYQIFQAVRCHSFLPHSMPVHKLSQVKIIRQTSSLFFNNVP
jgi:hypothetical protein